MFHLLTFNLMHDSHLLSFQANYCKRLATRSANRWPRRPYGGQTLPKHASLYVALGYKVSVLETCLDAGLPNVKIDGLGSRANGLRREGCRFAYLFFRSPHIHISLKSPEQYLGRYQSKHLSDGESRNRD